jgi:hypothetical protein
LTILEQKKLTMKFVKFIISGILCLALISCGAEVDVTADDTTDTEQTDGDAECGEDCEKKCCKKDKHECTEACGDECKADHECTEECAAECKAKKADGHVCGDECKDGCTAHDHAHSDHDHSEE